MFLWQSKPSCVQRWTKRYTVNHFACCLTLTPSVMGFFSVRLLSFLRGRFFIPATTANDLRLRKDFYTRSYQLHYFPILILKKEPVFPFSMFSAKQENYWYHFVNNVFDMTRSLTGDWTRDLPHSMPALYH